MFYLKIKNAFNATYLFTKYINIFIALNIIKLKIIVICKKSILSNMRASKTQVLGRTFHSFGDAEHCDTNEYEDDETGQKKSF